jgi:tetratricopeptide (TPR) repeat protein/predicted Ser/Thr protein kinase
VIGTQISHYRILSRIGQGGMGEVYLAQDLTLDRKAALKFLPTTQSADQSARKRLAREAQSAARLDHPFICKVYEVGQADDRPFIAMEYVEGTTLKDRLAAGPLPVFEAVRIASELAEALELAHQRGIVHRDLKPPNVMLTPDGHVKVMDFGLAKQVIGAGGDFESLGTMTLTQTGDVAGTVAYMSPEQLRGFPLDARSDIFAFGLLLHETVTGAHPFRRSSTFSTADAILNEQEPALDRYVSDAPPLLSHVISRCLAKDREQRYQSMRDVIIELKTLAGDSASSSRRPMAPPRRRSWWFAAAAIALVATLGAFAIWRWSSALQMSQRALAFKARDWIVIADFENLTGDKVFDRSLRAASDVGIAQSRFVNVFPQGRVQDTLRRMQKPAADRLDETLAAEVAVREGIKAVLVGSIAQVGDVYSITMRLIDPQSRLAVMTESVQAKGKDQVLPALDTLATRLRRGLGESLAGISYQSVPLPKATTSSLEALKMYADSLRVIASDSGDAGADLLRQAVALDADFALAHAELGRRYYLKSDRASRVAGEEHFVKALGLLDRLSTRERLWISAIAEDSRGNRRQAVDAYMSYLAQYPDDGRGWFRVGWTQMAGLGQLEPAIDAFKRTLALNASDAGAHVNLATCYKGLDRNREAVEEYQKAFALEPQLLVGDFVNHEYGFTLIDLGELDRAAEIFGKMTAERDNRARGLRSLALLEMYRGRYEKALVHLREAIVINHTRGAGVSEFRDRLYLVRALDAKGLTREFVSELAAADALAARTSLGPEWLKMLAKIHARSGHVQEARRLLAVMSKTAADRTTGSSVSRDAARDQTYLDLVRGEIELADGRPGDAAKRFEAAYALEARDPDTLESLATAAVAGGRLEEAVKRYEDLIAKRPIGNEGQQHWVRSHVRLGELYERLGRPDAARASYERLLAIWKDADADLVTLNEARAHVSKLGGAPPLQK